MDNTHIITHLSFCIYTDTLIYIAGLAVDKETGWICHLSYTHKVAVAWEGQEKVPTSGLYREYRGKRALTPKERRQRLKPLNDLFSMAECCLIADTVQFFKNSSIPYCPRNAVTDILNSIRETHISGDFHRIVAEQPERYFRPMPHLKTVLDNYKQANKRLIFVRYVMILYECMIEVASTWRVSLAARRKVVERGGDGASGWRYFQLLLSFSLSRSLLLFSMMICAVTLPFGMWMLE